ncbi:MAG TPA: HDOD domain-containing protein [Terriglobia bacterium]|nr:HDOD domain-containing protein [Terriglobia bacterium]
MSENADSQNVECSYASLGSPSVAHSPTRFIARQPIFDRREHVYGYELLYRSGLENRCTADDRDVAALDVADNFLNANARTLTAGRKAFINCTRQFLVNEYATLFPKRESVIEILENIEPDAEVLAACRKLKDRGYAIALDDFVCSEKYQPFVNLANIIKVDFQLSAPTDRQRAVAKFAPLGIQLLAEKVETRDEFAEALSSGYRYFQGYFFCEPQIVPSKQIPAFKAHYLRLLHAINKPELDRNEIVQLIDHEVSLCYKLLRFMNSPLFGFLSEIHSTRHALALLGDQEVKKWASVAAVLGVADNKLNELVLTALARGHCCELLAMNRGTPKDRQSMFLLGIFSLMDAMLGRPLSEIVSEIALPNVVRAALLGKPSRHRQTLELVKAFEAGRWGAVSELVAALGQDELQLAAAYVEAVDWAQKIFQV